MPSTPQMGDNVTAPYAEGLAERLELDYGELLTSTDDALSDAEGLPQVVESQIDVSAIAEIVKKLRDLSARAVSHRVAEKEPYLRAGEVVYAFFTKRVVDPLNAKGKELNGRIDAYKQRQLAEERARREAEAAAARQRQLEAQKAREEAEAAARRARSAQAIEARKAEAARAKVEENLAAIAAEETELATMASSTSMVRERFEGNDRSGIVGMRKQNTVYITDVAALDLELLRPYLKHEWLEQALRQWAKATNFEQQMAGAVVEQRDTTVVR
jgi:hypothetical protein